MVAGAERRLFTFAAAALVVAFALDAFVYLAHPAAGPRLFADGVGVIVALAALVVAIKALRLRRRRLAV